MWKHRNGFSVSKVLENLYSESCFSPNDQILVYDVTGRLNEQNTGQIVFQCCSAHTVVTA